MKKKRFLALFLILILIPCFSFTSSAAVSSYYDLVGVLNDSDRYNGDISYTSGYIKGDFVLMQYENGERPYLKEYALRRPFTIIEDYRDSNGDGVTIWAATFVFQHGFSLASGNGDNWTDPFEYRSIYVEMYSVDAARGIVREITFLGANGLTVYRYDPFDHSNDVIESQVIRLADSFDDRNYIIGQGTNEQLYYCYDVLFGWVSSESSFYRFGMFRPVRYIDLPLADDPDLGGSHDYSDVGTVGGAILRFLNVIMQGFERILAIEFFDGLFSFGTVIGLVVGFALIKLFLKYFAGG